MRYTPLCLAIGLLAAVASTATGQPLYDWTDGPPVDAPATVAYASAAGPFVESKGAVSHPVRLDLDLLREGPALLALPTPDGETVWAVRDGFEDHGDGDVTWTGRETASEYNSVRIVVREDRLFGMFGMGKQRHVVSGSSALARVRPMRSRPVPHHEHDHLHAPVPPVQVEAEVAAAPAFETIESVTAAAGANAAASTKATIDVLVLYSAQAESDWEEYFEIEPAAAIAYDAKYVNDVFANSQVPATIRVVHHQRMPDSLDPGNDGVQDEWSAGPLDLQAANKDVKALRGEHDADIVLMYTVNDGDWCGRAFAWARNGKEATSPLVPAKVFSRNYAHAAVDLDCWWYFDHPSALSVAHEIGHTHGLYHDKQNDYTTLAPQAPYAYGFVDYDEDVNTTMAYCDWCDEVAYFSNVRVTPNDWTLGKVNEAENERLIKITAAQVATFSDYLRPAKPTIRSVEDSYQAGAVIIYWNDNADNETHYEIRYRRAGQQWEDAPWNAAHDRKTDQTKAFIDGLARGKRYTLRVFAVNDYGKRGSEKVYHRPR